MLEFRGRLMRPGLALAVASALALAALALSAAEPPENADQAIQLAWSDYRSGRFEDARARFAAVLADDLSNAGARTGLGYALMQLERAPEAIDALLTALDAQPQDGDALLGLFLAAARAPVAERAAPRVLAHARAALLDETRPQQLRRAAWGVVARAERIFERRPRAPLPASAPLRVLARALRHHLEVAGDDGVFRPLFVKGFNLGVALPGRYPSEFPEDVETYAGFLDTLTGLGANTVRLYTLLPPAFYEALARHNARASAEARADARRIWLVQGVWTELPPGHDFEHEGYVADLEAEIARVIDAVHGNLMLAPRPGHASGLYEHDASESVLAYIIGREWEPFAVVDHEALHPGRADWRGRYLRVTQGTSMERWVAARCDFAARYEADRYRELHPLTFANWPTLDPLHHPKESSRAEEDAWRRHYGIEVAGRLAQAAWDNDSATIDATRIHPTEAMPAGFFAAYHIYPNYPDFLNLDDSLLMEKGASRRTRYAGYLHRLKRHHGEQPVLVAEFGMSTSRGVAHVQPEGRHHGGIDERQQGVWVGEMLTTIRDEGYAGGIVFAFVDEWFKGTWSVAPLELPAENRRRWFNAESPEQSYGVLAARPARVALRLDGDASDWASIAPLVAEEAQEARGWASLRSLRLAADEGYLHVLLQTDGQGAPDWSALRYRLAIDTYDDARGERTLPSPGATSVPTGIEFVVELTGPETSRVLVSLPYEPYERLDRGVVFSTLEPSGFFLPLFFEANRERFARDGTRHPPEIWERGRLRFGSLDPTSPLFDTRADVAIGADGAIEIRLPWGLLNVTDPSTHQVLHAEGGAWTRTTEGFRVYALALDAGALPLDRLPRDPAAAPPRWLWDAWTEPTYRLELKHGADALRRAMEAIPDRPEISK